MAVETCAPEPNPCLHRGLNALDWGWNIFKSLCNVQGWLGAIQDNTSVSPFGQIAVEVANASIVPNGSVRQVTIPASAVSIQVTIDEAYASDFALTLVQPGGGLLVLPEGQDLVYPFISPLFNADVNGQDVTQGHGVYPQVIVRYPIGAKGFISATYRGTASPITVSNI